MRGEPNLELLYVSGMRDAEMSRNENEMCVWVWGLFYLSLLAHCSLLIAKSDPPRRVCRSHSWPHNHSYTPLSEQRAGGARRGEEEEEEEEERERPVDPRRRRRAWASPCRSSPCPSRRPALELPS